MPRMRADGDDAGTADAGHEDGVGLVERRHRRFGQRGLKSRERRLPRLPQHRRHSTVTKLGQKPLRQEKVLVAGRLVDRALAAEFGLHAARTDTQFDFTPQSPQPSQTSSLMTTRLSGSG